MIGIGGEFALSTDKLLLCSPVIGVSVSTVETLLRSTRRRYLDCQLLLLESLIAYERDNSAPHGIKYCLTLHDKDNKRILGYDNAHDCLPKLRRYRAKKEKQGVLL